MEIKSATEERPATIELSEEEKKKIAEITPDFFFNAPDFPEGICSIRSVKKANAEKGVACSNVENAC